MILFVNEVRGIGDRACASRYALSSVSAANFPGIYELMEILKSRIACQLVKGVLRCANKVGASDDLVAVAGRET
jgi:hypothetical protein